MGRAWKLTARISVLEPRPRDLAVLLVEVECEVGEVVLQLIRQVQAGCPGTDTNDSHVPVGVDGLVAHLELGAG